MKIYQQLLNEVVASGVPGIQFSVQQETLGLWTGAAGKADLSDGN